MNDEKSLYRRLGQALRSARESADLSQDQVADELGIHRITYTNLENGKAGAPFYLVLKAAEFFGFSLDQFKAVHQQNAESSPDISPSVAKEIQKIRNELFATGGNLT